MDQPSGSIVALDVGERRIGVALAHSVARLARPVAAWERDDTFVAKLQDLIRQEDVQQLVVGLPRNLSGDDTQQTTRTRQFVEQLEKDISLPVAWQDEALTSRQAEQELQRSGRTYAKGDIDALAATYILEDYLQAATGRHQNV